MSVGPILSWAHGRVKSPARKGAEDARPLVPRILYLSGLASRVCGLGDERRVNAVKAVALFSSRE
jgi:hypothetical protein